MKTEKRVHWSVHVSRTINPAHMIFDNINVEHEEFARFMVKSFKAAGYHSYAVRCTTVSGVDFKSEKF